MLQKFTDKVRQAFSASADQYDILTSLHKEIGRELVKKHLRRQADTLVDIGCGTGYVANKAKFFYPNTRIIGLDVAEGMLNKAQELHEGIAIDWLQADAAQLPFKNRSVDIMFSNLAYQWVEDLPSGFAEARRVLSDRGLLAATMFGSRTCEELFDSLGAAGFTGARRLPDTAAVTDALTRAGFKDVSVDYELIKIQFEGIGELLSWLKAIGANNLQLQENAAGAFLGREKIARAGAYYREHYPYHHGICASFEVIWLAAG